MNISVATQGYAAVKKRTKKNKNSVLRKVVLIYNRSKLYINKRRFRKDTTLYKYDCLFDMVILTKNNISVLQVWEVRHNYEPTLSGVYSTYKKIIMTQDI